MSAGIEDKIIIVSKLFKKAFGDDKNLEFFAAPGRVNLIGEHIDYCGGYVFPAALTLDNVVAIRKNGTVSTVNMAASTIDGVYSFDISDIERARALKWGNYQAGVVRELMKAGLQVGGFDIAFHGTVPFGSGLSSSASIELATGLAVSETFGGNFDNVRLALMGQAAENNFCGVNCGIMDQFASAMGKKNNAIMLNCGTLDYKYVPLNLGDNMLVLANTCKKHALGASKYNERRREVAEGLLEMQRLEHEAGVTEVKEALCDYNEAALKELVPGIGNAIIRNRVTHVISENLRVQRAVKVLTDGDLAGFGELMREANDSIRYLYEATGEELDAMWDAAVGFEGCIGARMCGGGFGGCTVNIVNANAVEDFKKTVGAAYNRATGNKAEFYVCEIGDGARKLV